MLSAKQGSIWYHFYYILLRLQAILQEKEGKAKAIITNDGNAMY